MGDTTSSANSWAISGVASLLPASTTISSSGRLLCRRSASRHRRRVRALLRVGTTTLTDTCRALFGALGVNVNVQGSLLPRIHMLDRPGNQERIDSSQPDRSASATRRRPRTTKSHHSARRAAYRRRPNGGGSQRWQSKGRWDLARQECHRRLEPNPLDQERHKQSWVYRT